MAWNIFELDKEKTEQSIVNELARLDSCRMTLNALEREYICKSEEYRNKLSDIENKITEIQDSIKSGENYIKKCNEHLKDFE